MKSGATGTNFRPTAGRKRYLVTGATGFLGAHLAEGLLRKGHTVTAIVRSDKRLSAEQRFHRVLDWFGYPRERERVTVVEGDITLERCGLTPEAWSALAGGVDEIIHSAAYTGFAEHQRCEAERVNVGGTRNMLTLAAAGPIRAFHLVSTAFAVGRGDGTFINPYEETKRQAELLAESAAAESGLSLSIFRPSIVYGNSRTGRSLIFNALYYPVKTALFIRDIYLADLRRGGEKARAAGIMLLPDGRLRFPLRLETDPESRLNLIPVNYFVACVLKFLAEDRVSGRLPISTDENITTTTIMRYSCRRYGLASVRAVLAADLERKPRTPFETLFEQYLGVYRPYLRDRRNLMTAEPRTDVVLHCPRFTYEVFSRIMDYAESVDWGKKLFAANSDILT